ncbi:MAG: sulfite exporter TauE/SafE family protein [Crocinitomicaceae bacterium]
MLWSAFILGLAGSLHCIGMCGPIALLIPTVKGQKKWISIFLYQSGKLLTYIIIGALFGIVVVSIYNYNIQSTLTITSGCILLIFALIPKVLNYVEKNGYQFFNGVIKFKTKLTKALNKNRIEYSFYIGFLNGFIPCAMVYSAAIIALSQKTFTNSIVFMIFFGFGTIPLMTIFYFTANQLKSKLTKYATNFRMWSFIIVGIFLIWRGFSTYNHDIPKVKEGAKFKLCLPF